MRIAVAGDVHGHLALLYAILGRWQRESGSTIDLILQVGDLGAFAPGSRVDRATRWHAERDPEELEFGLFAGPDPPAAPMDPRPPLVFIPGNHEDFDYLDECESRVPKADALYPVSADRRILALKSGRIWTFEARGRRLRIAGVSGVAGRESRPGRHPRLHLREDDVMRVLERGPGSVDVFLSHEGPLGIWGGDRVARGSPALGVLIEELQPPLAFFGHYDRVGEWRIGRTRLYALAGCGYDQGGVWPVKRGGIAVMEWDGPDARVDRLRDRWLAEANRTTWRSWSRQGPQTS
ncbi:MAG: metallophosphoesterase family protein [Gemmatimonadales bacterium]